MKKAFGIAGALGIVLSLPLIAGDKSSGQSAGRLAETSSGSLPEAKSDSGLKIRRTKTVRQPYMMTDPKTGAPVTEYRSVSYDVEQEVPTDPRQIEAMRQQLRELQEQRIELLSPAALMEEIEAQQKDTNERKSWKRLQEVRQLLDAISVEFPETKADACARDAQRAIPKTDEPTSPKRQPTPVSGTAAGPLPIKGI